MLPFSFLVLSPSPSLHLSICYFYILSSCLFICLPFSLPSLHWFSFSLFFSSFSLSISPPFSIFFHLPSSSLSILSKQNTNPQPSHCAFPFFLNTGGHFTLHWMVGRCFFSCPPQLWCCIRPGKVFVWDNPFIMAPWRGRFLSSWMTKGRISLILIRSEKTSFRGLFKCHMSHFYQCYWVLIKKKNCISLVQHWCISGALLIRIKRVCVFVLIRFYNTSGSISAHCKAVVSLCWVWAPSGWLLRSDFISLFLSHLQASTCSTFPPLVKGCLFG